MSGSEPAIDGPSRVFEAPDVLVGRVVDWRGDGAIHGYGIADDLAVNYAVHETFLLALTGTPPSAAYGKAFGAALTWIAAAHVGTAPTHAAALAGISGAPDANLMAIATLAAGREAERLLDDHAALLERVAHEPASGPGSPAGRSDWRSRLLHASELDLPGLDAVDSAGHAALIVFHHVGVRTRREIVIAWIWGRLIGVTAESLAEPALDMRTYPLGLPTFEYREPSS